MSNSKTVEKPKQTFNGVDVDQVMEVIGAIEDDADYAKFQWRATNKWIDGAVCRSRFKEFYAGNAEDMTRQEEFLLDADEPAIAAGRNTAPNAMEYLLHALAACLTGTLVYHAAVRGIKIDEVESSYAGDMDVRGLFGMSEDVRKGFSKVAIIMRVKSEASIEELTEMALFSPVYDVVSNSLPVKFTLTTY
jgi:uncharacterized OsmC-like protein